MSFWKVLSAQRIIFNITSVQDDDSYLMQTVILNGVKAQPILLIVVLQTSLLAGKASGEGAALLSCCRSASE